MVKHALIDADIVAHRVGFTTENDEFWVARARCDDMIDKILLDTCVSSYDLWLSGSAQDNFRYQIYPQYKANRIGKPRPKHLEAIKSYLVTEWGARFAEGMEADDYLGILQDEDGGTTVICSIDKDLKQIPGKHYNFVKEEWDEVDYPRAIREFYKQLIIGDVSDNIPGAYGMGPVKASRAIDSPSLAKLEGDELELKCMEAVRILWQTSLAKEWGPQWTKAEAQAMNGLILMSGRLLKIRRSFKEGLWDFPSLSQTEEYLSLFTQPAAADNALFTEHTALPEMNGFPVAGSPAENTSPQPNQAS